MCALKTASTRASTSPAACVTTRMTFVLQAMSHAGRERDLRAWLAKAEGRAADARPPVDLVHAATLAETLHGSISKTFTALSTMHVQLEAGLVEAATCMTMIHAYETALMSMLGACRHAEASMASVAAAHRRPVAAAAKMMRQDPPPAPPPPSPAASVTSSV